MILCRCAVLWQIAAIWLVSMAVAPGVMAQIAGFVGGDARVIIFDASGTMRNASFDRNSRTRIDVAREVLVQTFRQLYDRVDPRPTALMVFGAGQSWDDQRDQFGRDERKVPVDHALCTDVETRMGFAAIDGALVQQAERISTQLQWNGMTPLHNALLQALRSFDGDIADATLELILISDFEDANCLPPGASVCDMLQAELGRIRGARGRVEAKVFETPVSRIRESLSACIPVSTHGIDRDNPDPEATVIAALSTWRLTPELTLDGNVLDPAGILPDGARYQIARADGSIASSGPHGAFDLSAGDYLVTVGLDGITQSGEIDLQSDNGIVLSLPPATLAVLATSAGGAVALDRLDILTATGSPVAAVDGYATGSPLLLANREYRIVGTDAAGRTASAVVALRLGTAQEVTLDFGAALATPRDVLFSVSVAQPTLNPGGAWTPAVELIHPNGVRQPLPLTQYSATLDSGRYEIRVDGGAPLRFDVDASATGTPLRVDLHITPGWFTAQSSKGSGRFELADSGGKVLYSFDGATVQHSLPEGRYVLSFVGADGQDSSQDIEISAGHEAALNPY